MADSRPVRFAGLRRRRTLLGVAGMVAVLLAAAVFVAVRPNAQPPATGATTAAQPTQRSSHDGDPPAPDFTVQTLDGATFSLADRRGQVVVVEFLAPGCPSCTVDVAGLSDAARANPDATFLIADISGAPNPRTLRDYYRGELAAPPELLIAQDTDFQLARAYGVRALGHTAVIAADGRLSWTGTWTGDEARLATQIQQAANS